MDYDKQQRIREIRNIISDNDRQCFFSIADIAKMIGKKKYDTAKKFVDDLPCIKINGRACYFVGDIAKKVYQNQTN